MKTGADLYLLAHPDDDLWVRPRIQRDPARAHIVFLSAADGSGRFPIEVRAREVHAALAPLGVSADRIRFIGAEAAIPDGQMHQHLDRAFIAADAYCQSIGPVARILTHAWEGGHPDHDACHLVALALAKKLGVLADSLVAPGYRRPASGFPPFIVFAPLPGNGAIAWTKLSAQERWGVFRAMFHYASQWKTFLGLGPLITAHALFSGRLPAQALSTSSAPKRPQVSPLLYEARNGLSFVDFRAACAAFLAGHDLDHAATVA